VHERHASDGDLYPRLAGWWGVPIAKRFAMAQQYDEAAGARGFGVSNVNPLLVASVYGSLQAFGKAGGVRSLRRKSVLLTGYLEALLHARGLLETAIKTAEGKANSKGRSGGATLRLVTPADPKQRGCQLSLRVIPAPSGCAAGKPPVTMRALEEALRERGVVGDAREPDTVRLAPTPLYNTFTDVWRAVAALEDALH
jgi:kynureninase